MGPFFPSAPTSTSIWQFYFSLISWIYLFQTVSFSVHYIIFIYFFCNFWSKLMITSTLYTANRVVGLKCKSGNFYPSHEIKSKPLRWHKKLFMIWHWLDTHCPWLMLQQYWPATGPLHTADYFFLCVHFFFELSPWPFTPFLTFPPV